MAAYVLVGISLALLIFFLTLFSPVYLATTNASSLGITIDTSILTIYFFVFCTIYNAMLLSVIVVYDRLKFRSEDDAEDHHFSIIIPCRNEEAVIGKTLSNIAALDYPEEKYNALIVNDGSTDRTSDIAHEFADKFSNIKVLDVPKDESGKGKGAALNRAYHLLLELYPNYDKKNWIIGVFDADGSPEKNMLKKMSYQFKDETVGAAQAIVRISNRNESLLARLQDIEFITFAKVTQYVRNIFKGAVALGGNGQFIRATALESIVLSTGELWRRNALTEDLDLGTRLLLKGWNSQFIITSAVHQQGVHTLAALYKQRTRWAWGALQAFITYVISLEVFRGKKGSIRKIDLAYYLSCPIIPLAILLCWAISIISVLGMVSINNPFPAYFMIANAISFFPLMMFGLWTTRKEYPLRNMIPLLFIANAYTYHWIIASIRAIIHVLKRDSPVWAKTARAPEIIDKIEKRIS